MMKLSLKIKQISSILLFITFFLPLSECAKKPVIAEPEIVPYDSATEPVDQKNDAVEGTMNEKFSDREFSTIIEPFAVLGSAYVIAGIAFFGEILFAGYLAIASIVIYFLASCYDIFSMFRYKKQQEPVHSHEAQKAGDFG